MVNMEHYEYWTANPISILNSDLEISNNVDMDSPGFTPRDYRFYPEFRKVSGDDIPTELDMFYAWQSHNEEEAKRYSEEMDRRHQRQQSIFDKQRFSRTYSGTGSNKKYFLWDLHILTDYMGLINDGLEVESLEYDRDYIARWNTIIPWIELSSSMYKQTKFRRFVQLSLKLIDVIQRRRGDQETFIIHQELKILYNAIMNGIEYS